VLLAPRHPYTQALLASVPQARAAWSPPASSALRGAAAAVVEISAGCRYQARCPYKIGAICETVPPPLRHVSPSHRAACHLDAPLG